jgi:hypothetical protein
MRTAPADRRLAALLLALGLGGAVAGASAQAPAPAPKPASVEVDLGTLFTSPEERARLDRLRRGEPVQAATSGPTGQRAVTGYVKRSDGRSTVWIDGVPLQVATPKAAPMLDPGAVRSGTDDRGIRFEAKPPAR